MYRRGETGQIARALRVLGALRGFKHGRRIAEIAQEVGASERTVRRDLGELRDAGFDIEIAKVDQRSIALLAVEKTYSRSRSPRASDSRCSQSGTCSRSCGARRFSMTFTPSWRSSNSG